MLLPFQGQQADAKSHNGDSESQNSMSFLSTIFFGGCVSLFAGDGRFVTGGILFHRRHPFLLTVQGLSLKRCNSGATKDLCLILASH